MLLLSGTNKHITIHTSKFDLLTALESLREGGTEKSLLKRIKGMPYI